MSYLCQECKSNNNGWCTVRKCNGLKKLNIDSCNTYESRNVIEFENGSKITEIKDSPTRGKRSELKPVDDYSNLKDENDNTEAYRVLGKRQMLWSIQLQVMAINDKVPKEERYDALVKCLKSIAKIQQFEEGLYKVEDILESVIDEDMIEQSKYMDTKM